MRRNAEARFAVMLSVVVGLAAGCTTTHRTTDTSRSATEELLLNSALECALSTIDFGFFAGMNVYYDGSNLEALDKGWINHRLRESLLTRGASLIATRDDADVVVEAAVGTYGTNNNAKTIGIHNFNMLPDVTLSRAENQFGSTSLSVFATDRATGQLLWRSGPSRCDSHLRTRYLLGGGPFYNGTIQHPAATYEPYRDRTNRFLGESPLPTKHRH